jgi:7,8-dihydropterin-6-yl-methyl-4-(beta-D-ribofuranosyl)aminobenzene 5'-phosphate synthase
MDIKVAVLVDNTVGIPPFRAEHGLSVWLEVDGRSFLWDCGQSDVAVFNANVLGIDLRKIEGIGLSHGHLDHAGGLQSTLQATGPKPIYAHPVAWDPRYMVAGTFKMFVGIPLRKEACETMCAGIHMSREPVEVLPSVWLTGEVPRVTDFEGPEPALFIERDGELIPDPFEDDQALVIKKPDGCVVLTGCAHSGLVNIMKHVAAEYGPVKAIVGGTHLGMGAPESKIAATMEFLDGALPEKIVINHCTGSVVVSRMLDRYKERFVPGQAGMVLSL